MFLFQAFKVCRLISEVDHGVVTWDAPQTFPYYLKWQMTPWKSLYLQ